MKRHKLESDSTKSEEDVKQHSFHSLLVEAQAAMATLEDRTGVPSKADNLNM